MARERELERKRKRDSDLSTESVTTPITHATPQSNIPRSPKTITLISGGARVLPKLPQAVSKKAEKKLKKLGVHVVHNLRELGHTAKVEGPVHCHLNNDMTITADLLISATGVTPNTQFLPRTILNEKGYIVTDRATLRVYGQSIGERIYAVGDCATYSRGHLVDAYEPIPVVVKNLQNDLLAHEFQLQTIKARRSSARPASPTIPLSSPLPIKGELKPRLSFPAPTVPVQRLKTSDSKAKAQSEATSPSPSVPTTCSPLLTPIQACLRIAELEDAKFTPNPKETVIVPITRFGGTGVVRGWRVPGCVVWLMKGRDYGAGRAKDVVAKGG